MIKIGDFSKLSQVPVKTLRYYSDLGLLKPVFTDRFTSYRYYSADQLLQLNRILALRDLGISLEQIGVLLKEGLPADHMMGILRQKQVELGLQIEADTERLGRLMNRLKQFEQENQMSTLDVVIKSIPEITVASVRGKVPTYPAQGVLWEELEANMRKAGVRSTGICFTIDHDEEYQETDHDLEVCEPVADGTKTQSGLSITRLPAVPEMASMIHHGAFNTLTGSYQKLLNWLEENKYQIYGPGREIYISTSTGIVRQDDPSYVVEIQFPVKKSTVEE